MFLKPELQKELEVGKSGYLGRCSLTFDNSLYNLPFKYPFNDLWMNGIIVSLH